MLFIVWLPISSEIIPAICTLNIGEVYLYALHTHKTLKLPCKGNKKGGLVSLSVDCGLTLQQVYLCQEEALRLWTKILQEGVCSVSKVL